MRETVEEEEEAHCEEGKKGKGSKRGVLIKI